jgi:hypothetical protein
MNLVASLSEAIRQAPSVSCSVMAGAPLASPDDLADAIYRRFTFLRTEREPDGATRVVFRSRGEQVAYEFVVEVGCVLPREIRRIERPGAAPETATCSWEAPRRGAADLPPRTEP